MAALEIKFQFSGATFKPDFMILIWFTLNLTRNSGACFKILGANSPAAPIDFPVLQDGGQFL